MRRKPRSLPIFSITPVSSPRIRCAACCSFFCSSFSRSSASRRRSRTFRWSVSSFSRRASGDSTRPFFSISSRSLSTSTLRLSTSFCIVALSFSSCSRAATPATERTMTRWTSTYPMRVPAASVPAAGPPTSAPATSAATPKTHLLIRASPPAASGLEGRPDREVDLEVLLPRLLVQVVAQIEPHGAQRREEANPHARRVPQILRIEGGSEAVRVARVKEERQPEPGEDRDEELGVEEELLVAADDVSLGILGSNRPRPLSPERGGAAQEEALEDRHLLAAPPLGHPEEAPDGPHEVEHGQRHEPRRLGDELVELGVPAQPREHELQRVPAALRRLEGVVSRVPEQIELDHRVERRALLLLQVH